MSSDRIISGGKLIDGTGGPAMQADVMIRDGLIKEIAPPGSFEADHSCEVIDASSQVVSPGFIDLHSHGDLILAGTDEDLRRKLQAGRIAQGITTEVVGNCGLGPAPTRPSHEAELRGVISWMTPEDAGWPWCDIGGYLAHLEEIHVPVNVATLVAHGAIRIAEAGLNRPLPNADSISSMETALEDALKQGAFGLSLGLIYPPGSFTSGGEIAALAPIVGRREALITSHIRGSSETLLDAVGELLDLGRGTGARIHHSHSEAVGPDHWFKIDQVLQAEAKARAEGVPVTFDMFPYTAAATTMAAIYPPWSLQGGIPALVERLKQPGTREAICRDIETVVPQWPPWTDKGWAHNLVRAVGWERITVGTVGSPAGRWSEGLDLKTLGQEEDKSPFQAISDLMIAEEGNVSQIIHGISGDASDDSGLVRLMTDPFGAICTDANDMGRGRPHPAAYGTYPKLLGEYVRERAVLSLEEAIRKITSYPASILGLKNRGVIRKGFAADLVVFDPELIGSGATYREPRGFARGISAVLVNGELLMEKGKLASINPGVVLRRGD
jgi:N-acyl-D-amino-acid deacylase